MQEFAPRRAGAPDDNLVLAARLGFVRNLRISAGSTWLVARSKLSFGP